MRYYLIPEKSYKEYLDYKKKSPKVEKINCKKIFEYYQNLGLIKHRSLTDVMKKALLNVAKKNNFTTEDMIELLNRHKKIVDITSSTQYKVQKRSLSVFFRQKIDNTTGSMHIYEEYMDGGKKWEHYKNQLSFNLDKPHKQPKPKNIPKKVYI